ncbi:hypothetical protein A2U01_0105506, partial [Trifolium medium]|nr:hypothetical protein [Trifolium medium]
ETIRTPGGIKTLIKAIHSHENGGPEAKDTELEKERLWHSKIFDLGNSIIRLKSTGYSKETLFTKDQTT